MIFLMNLNLVSTYQTAWCYEFCECSNIWLREIFIDTDLFILVSARKTDGASSIFLELAEEKGIDAELLKKQVKLLKSVAC